MVEYKDLEKHIAAAQNANEVYGFLFEDLEDFLGELKGVTLFDQQASALLGDPLNKQLKAATPALMEAYTEINKVKAKLWSELVDSYKQD